VCNIVLPWNGVPTSSRSIFQTSCEHVLVSLTVCTGRALSDRMFALIVAIVLLILQRTTRSTKFNHQYRPRQYIVIHQQQGLSFVVFGLTASTGSTEHLQERPAFEPLRVGLHPQGPILGMRGIRLFTSKRREVGLPVQHVVSLPRGGNASQ
jgi:hypothetical protein